MIAFASLVWSSPGFTYPSLIKQSSFMFYLDSQILFAFILPFLLLLHPLRRKVREELPTRVNSTGDSAVPISWHSSLVTASLL